MPKLSAREWALLEVLWDKGPSTGRDVLEGTAERYEWAYNTVKTMLDRMVAKGVLEVRSVGRVREYRATLDRQAAQQNAWDRLVDKAFDGRAATALSFVASRAELSPEKRAALEALLEDLDD